MKGSCHHDLQCAVRWIIYYETHCYSWLNIRYPSYRPVIVGLLTLLNYIVSIVQRRENYYNGRRINAMSLVLCGLWWLIVNNRLRLYFEHVMLLHFSKRSTVYWVVVRRITGYLVWLEEVWTKLQHSGDSMGLTTF